MYRRLLAGALAAACALAISACGVKFNGAPTGAQRDVIGDVVITTKLCSTDQGGACGAVGADEFVQSLLAYRVPADAKAPTLSTAGGVVYNRDDDLAQWYQDHDPADGTRWYAFVSEPVETHAADQLSETVEAAFGLPGGAPYHGPFDYKTTTGFRELGSAAQAEAPVNCFIVSDDRSIEAPSAACAAESATGSVDTRDLALAASSATSRSRAHMRASVQQGASGDVPFMATFAGTTTPDADFALSATAPGLGAVTVSPDHLLTPTDSATPLTVHVDVPAGASPGDYPVTLTARLSNGQTRTATGTITVTAAPVADAAPAQTTTTVQGVTFTAPSTKTCLSRRLFTIMLLRHGRDLVDGSVALNGKPVAVRRGGKHMTARIDLRGLAAGTVSVKIVAKTAEGRTVRFTRRYRTCTTTPGSNELPRKEAI